VLGEHGRAAVGAHAIRKARVSFRLFIVLHEADRVVKRGIFYASFYILARRAGIDFTTPLKKATNRCDR
ncbi:MAG TPA: hypothetical protein VF410_06645, partial [Rhizomicrobium sp.]